MGLAWKEVDRDMSGQIMSGSLDGGDEGCWAQETRGRSGKEAAGAVEGKWGKEGEPHLCVTTVAQADAQAHLRAGSQLDHGAVPM